MVTMDEDTSKLYIQNLEEYVLDEAKTVTYKWLSRELNLHVNLAKELLYTFLKEHQSAVHATYLLSGLLRDEVTHKILIVQAEDLEKAKLQFKVLSSEHVYSIQKPKEMADINTLYVIDRYSKDDSDGKRLNSVCCNDAVERAADEIARLKIKVRASATSTDIRAWPAANKKPATEVNKENGTVATTSEEKVAAKKEEKKYLKSGGIVAMFAAQSMKAKQENTAEKTRASGKPAPNSKGCFLTFFNRNTEKAKEKNEPSVPVVAKDESKADESKADESKADENKTDESKASDSKTGTKVRSKSEPSRKEKKVNSAKPSTAQPKNKRKSSDEPQPLKRRRRILCISDSENSDNDIFGSDDEEEPLQVPELAPVTMVESDEEVITSTPLFVKNHGRKRERKLKLSTYMDEDGYVVTQREYVVESCTDSEGEENRKKLKTEENSREKEKDRKSSPPPEPPAKKKCSPQKVKQATLTNFFKKK